VLIMARDKITETPAKTIIRTLCQLGLDYPDHFAIAVARQRLPNGRRRLKSDPPGIPVGIRVDLIEDQVIERLVADNADFIEHETALAGYPFIVKVGRCTVCGQRQDGTLAEIEEGRR
jgi:hypothetical protein